MSREPAPDKPPRDGNSFWEALFTQEEANLPQQDAPAAPDSGHDQENGRFPQPDTSTTPWEQARACMNADETLRLQVCDYNKGGLIVYWNSLQGFVPASQLVDLPQFHIERQRLHALKEWVNTWLDLKIIELNPAANRLILSERAAQVEAQDRQRLLHRVKPGDTLRGRVTNLTDFGAFVELGGVEGLIHISELSWSRVSHPSQVLHPAQETEVVVLAVDPKNGRIALSRKRLKPDPWQGVELRYAPNQIVRGVVNNIVSYGAFVQLEDELEGLIHISELAEGSFLHPRDVVERGQQVRARVLFVDGTKKRLALSLRAIPPDEFPQR